MINASKLRSASQCPEAFVAIARADACMVADGLEIADDAAREDIESYCWSAVDAPGNPGDCWWNVGDPASDDAEMIEKALRYLTARELIEHHPERPELVRFVEKA